MDTWHGGATVSKGIFQEKYPSADLSNGLEIIGAGTFRACISLHHINIPHAIRSIQKMGICILLEVNNFGSQPRSCGDWGMGICLLHFPRMHCGTPHCDSNQQWGILGMHTVKDCNSPKWTKNDREMCIFLLQVHRKNQDPPLCHRHWGWCLQGVLKFDRCGVL